MSAKSAIIGKIRSLFLLEQACLVLIITLASSTGYAVTANDGFAPNPSPNNGLGDIAVQADGRIVIGGLFSSVDGVLRNSIARLNIDGSLDMSFDPNADSWVTSLAVQADGKILIGGSFTNVGGVFRNRIARLNPDGSLDLSFAPNVNGNNVSTITLQTDGRILIGGNFTDVDGTTRNNVARFNSDGSLDSSFDPDANDVVNNLVVQADGKILVGGNFMQIGGVTKNRIARLNADGSLDATFVANPNGQVLDIAIQPDGKIVIGGGFTTVDGVLRRRLARLNRDGSLDTPFNPDVRFSGGVSAVVVQPDGKILFGGSGNNVAFVTRNNIARLNPDGSLDTVFDPNANDPVWAIAIQADGKIVICGHFGQVGGVTRNLIARLYLDGGLDTDHNPNADLVVSSTVVQPDEKVLIGGQFRTVGGVTRDRVARFDTDGGLDSSFVANVGQTFPVKSVLSTAIQMDGKVVIGGDFTLVDGQARNGIARLNQDGSLDSTFNPDANGTVRSIALQPDGRILIGGGFTTIGGATRNYIARLNQDGTLDGTFSVVVNSGINAIALQVSGRIIIGGGFSSVNGVSRDRIARLNTDGSLITSFDANMFGQSVYAIAIQADGKIVIGGPFGQVGGFNRPILARITGGTGSLDTSFAPFAPETLFGLIYSIAVQTDGKILIGGEFQTLETPGQRRLARLNPDGSLDNTSIFGTGANDVVRSVALQSDGKILIGGVFTTTVGGVGRNRIARLTNPDAAFQTLLASADGSTVTWLRSGASPEVEWVIFESSNDTTTWTQLGTGSRTLGSWRLTGLSLPVGQDLYLRARGLARGGSYTGSSSLIESVRLVNLTLDSDGDGVSDADDNCINVPNGPLALDAGGNSQLDTDGDGYGNLCDGDLNNTGFVDFSDLTLFQGAFFTADPDADFNGDAFVDFLELTLFQGMFFQPPGPSCVDLPGGCTP